MKDEIKLGLVLLAFAIAVMQIIWAVTQSSSTASADLHNINLEILKVEQRIRERERYEQQEVAGNEQRIIVEDSKERITTIDDKLKTLRSIKTK